jgi:hypothetical protein
VVVIVWVVGFTTTCASCELESNSWLGVLDTPLCDKVCRFLAAGRWFSLLSFTNKTDRHNITNIVESGVKHHNPNPLLSITYILNNSYSSSLNVHFFVTASIKKKHNKLSSSSGNDLLIHLKHSNWCRVVLPLIKQTLL